MTRPSDQRCSECDFPACGGSTLCVRHLRGIALVTLDRKRWPRLKLRGQVISGDDQWRPWLREAGGQDFIALLRMLGVDPEKVKW
jgi:hypothetical protein